MLNKFEDMIIGKMVQQLNDHGINIDSDTIKKAIANSPQIVGQIEAILATPGAQDKISKINELLHSAASNTGSQDDNTK